MDEAVILEIPARLEDLTVVRLALSGACSAVKGIDVEQLEDAKVAVTEACMMLMQGKGCGRLQVGIWREDRLRFEVNALGEGEVLHTQEAYDPHFSTLLLDTLTQKLCVQEKQITFYLTQDEEL